MTLILLCYLCGQGEKVRLTMWMLIVAVTSYIAIFSAGIAGNQVYAMDIALTQGQTEVTVEQQVTTSVTTTPTVQQPSFTTSVPNSPVYSSSIMNQPASMATASTVMQDTAIDVYMAELFTLEATFQNHAAFEGSNKFVLEFTAEKMKGKTVEKQIVFLGKLVDVLSAMSKKEQVSYSINSDIIVPLLQFMIIKGETEPVSSQTHASKQGVFNKFNMSTPIQGMITFSLKEDKTVRLLNIYVNKQFVRSCDRNQCSHFSLDATQGDTITIYHTEGNLNSIIDEYTL